MLRLQVLGNNRFGTIQIRSNPIGCRALRVSRISISVSIWAASCRDQTCDWTSPIGCKVSHGSRGFRSRFAFESPFKYWLLLDLRTLSDHSHKIALGLFMVASFLEYGLGRI
jgi:hypothetical protein